MSNRLGVWLLVSVAICASVGVMAMGLHLLSVLALVHVPAVLAVMLLVRASLLLVQGRSPALLVGTRAVLAGRWAVLAPLLFLVLWTGAREFGLISVRACRTGASFSSSSQSSRWQEQASDRLPDRSELQFETPPGGLGEQFRDELDRALSAGPGEHLTGRVELGLPPPFAWLPLYKSAQLHVEIEVELELRRVADRTAPVRTATIQIEVDGTWTMMGFAAQRDFHVYLGQEMGRMTRKCIAEWLDKAREG